MPNGNGNGNGGGGGWSPPLPPDFPYGQCGNICGEYDFNGEIYVDRGSPFYECLNSLCSSSEYGGIILPYLFGWYGISLQGDCGTNYETSTYEVVCPNSNGDFTVPTSACVNSRYLALPLFSFLQTLPIAYLLYGKGSSL